MAVSKALQEKVRETAKYRCGYCLSQQKYVPAPLEIEHIIPRAKGGTDEEENLWLGCRLCNSYKGTQTEGFDPVNSEQAPLFNPRQQQWHDHFHWSADGILIIGKTSIGRATVNALRLNDTLIVEVRRNWVAAGWHPPQD